MSLVSVRDEIKASGLFQVSLYEAEIFEHSPGSLTIVENAARRNLPIELIQVGFKRTFGGKMFPSTLSRTLTSFQIKAEEKRLKPAISKSDSCPRPHQISTKQKAPTFSTQRRERKCIAFFTSHVPFGLIVGVQQRITITFWPNSKA